MSIRKTHPLVSIINSSLIDLPAPSNISHFWNFGSILGFCLTIQIITGIFLAIHFSADISTAFNCINHIMRDVDIGWFTRLIHTNGASLFFLSIYIHIGRGLYYNSFFLNFTWLSGVVIFLISIVTAFLGYVLPWGQISYWGATVITNLLSAIPYLGQTLVEWVWGGFSVNNATLTRFFSLHFIFPFLILGIVVAHFIFLHEQKSSNPLGLQNRTDKIYFHPYFIFKDIVRARIIIFLLIIINKINPFFLIDSENFSPANPLVTPTHIQPEWYFLFAYAILRAIPNKLGGVIGLLISIFIIFPLILKHKNYQLNTIRKTFRFWRFFVIFILLTWLGIKPVEEPFILLGILSTFLYFIWFLIILAL